MVWVWQGRTLKLEKYGHLLLCPWHFVYQFSTISKKWGFWMNIRTKISTFIVVKSGNFCMKVSPEAPFYWNLLKIGIRSAKDIIKDDHIFQVWGSALATPRPPLIFDLDSDYLMVNKIGRTNVSVAEIYRSFQSNGHEIHCYAVQYKQYQQGLSMPTVLKFIK